MGKGQYRVRCVWGDYPSELEIEVDGALDDIWAGGGFVVALHFAATQTLDPATLTPNDRLSCLIEYEPGLLA